MLRVGGCDVFILVVGAHVGERGAKERPGEEGGGRRREGGGRRKEERREEGEERERRKRERERVKKGSRR